MECLPPLPQDRARLLKLKWIALQASFRSTGSVDPWQTSGLASPRFNQVASEYWVIWEASEQRIEVFQQWLDRVKYLVSVEMASLWQTLRIEGGVEHKLSLHRENWRAIEAEFSRAIATWTRKAGELEIKRLAPDECPAIEDAGVDSVPDSAIEGNSPTDPKAKAIESGDNRQEWEKRPTEMARTLDKLRDECKWSFAALAKATSMSSTLIKGHINKGKGISIDNLKAYAAEFSRKLGRKITVAEITGNRAKIRPRVGPENREKQAKTGQNRASSKTASRTGQ